MLFAIRSNASALLANSTKRFLHKMSKNKPKVYVTRALNPEAITSLEESCEVTSWNGADAVPRNELLKNVIGKQGLLCLLTDKIDAEVLDKGTDLKVVSTMSVGYDHLDIKEIQNRNIKIGYTPNVLTEATAELTIALLLATSRRLIEASNAARFNEWKAWSPFWMCGPSLNNATVGIFGFGRIGQQVAKCLKPFEVKRILYCGRSDKPEAVTLGAVRVDFEMLCSESDFVIATSALTPETQGVFNKNAFNLMKPTCVFVNSSRGGVVDQEALVDALESKKIWAAGLDVMVPEPLPLDSPLFKLPNCVILPHIGSASIETRKRMAALAVENIKTALNNQVMPAQLKL